MMLLRELTHINAIVPASEPATDAATDSAIEREIRHVYRQWQSTADEAVGDGTLVGVVENDVCATLRAADKLLRTNAIEDFVAGLSW